MLVRTPNFTPAPDAPTKSQAGDTTLSQPSQELAQQCLSNAEHPRAAQFPVLESRGAGGPTQGSQSQTNLSHSPRLLLRLLTSSSSSIP